MGAHMSSEAGPHSGLGELPESCIAVVLGHLDPPEICRLARMNRAFRGASSADFIWESKLPPNYSFLMHKLFNFNHSNHNNNDHHGDHDEENDDHGDVLSPAFMGFTKKDIFACLSAHNLFDGGTKEIWLDKSTGGVCLSISSKALSITGIDDRRYWNRIPSEESRFQTMAYLVQIWWLEVKGSLEFKFPANTYSLFFRIQLGKSSKKFGRRICNQEHIQGWEIKPVQFQLSTSDGQHALSQCHLYNSGSWVLYHAGDFIIKDSSKLTMIKFSLTQIDCTHIKGGLSLDSVVICPKNISKVQL